MAQVGRELEANREAERGDEKPEEPAPEKEERDAEQRTEDGQRGMHLAKFNDERKRGQRLPRLSSRAQPRDPGEPP